MRTLRDGRLRIKKKGIEGLAWEDGTGGTFKVEIRGRQRLSKEPGDKVPTFASLLSFISRVCLAFL